MTDFLQEFHAREVSDMARSKSGVDPRSFYNPEHLERAARRMWELHAQERSWDDLHAVEREQVRWEAAHIIAVFEGDIE